MRKIYFILSFVSMAMGAAIYPLFRESGLMIWNVLPKPAFWDMCRIPWNKNNVFLSMLIGSAPDFLWFLSGIFLLRSLWFYRQKTQTVYIIVFYIIGAAYNAGQYFGIVPGTFCMVDVLTMAGVAVIEGALYLGFAGKRKLTTE